MTQPTRIQGSPVDSFIRYNDQDGNRLVSLNKDGSVSTTEIQFADGTTQSTAGGGGGGGDVLTNTIHLAAADILTLSVVDLVPGVNNKIIVPLYIIVQCLAESGGTPYSNSSGTALSVEFFGGGSLGGVQSQVFTNPSQDNIYYTPLSTNSLLDQNGAIGNPLELVNNGFNFAGGSPVGPYTVANGGSGYAPGDTGRWGFNANFTYEVSTVDGGGAILTFTVDTSVPDVAYPGSNGTSPDSGSGDGNFTIHVPSVTGQGTAPAQITTAYVLVDGAF